MKDVENDFERYLYTSLHDTDMESFLWSEELCNRIEERFIEENKKEYKNSIGFTNTIDTLPLYKYRSFDQSNSARTTTTIVDARLWSPSIARLNDPLEAAVILGSGTVDKWTVPAVSMYYQSPWCGCICLSYDPICIQMWAHYANNHEGYLLKYERSSNYLLRSKFCRPVNYRRKISALDVLNRPDSINEVFWTKSEAWEYEKEVRLQYPRTNAYTAVGLLKPSGIIFGLRTPVKVKDYLKEIASNLRIGQIIFGDHPYSLEVEWDG